MHRLGDAATRPSHQRPLEAIGDECGQRDADRECYERIFPAPAGVAVRVAGVWRHVQAQQLARDDLVVEVEIVRNER